MNNRLLFAILLLIFCSFSYGQTTPENVNIFGVEFLLINNRELSIKNNSNSIRVVEIMEKEKQNMNFANINWKNRMNVDSKDKIFLTKENSEINLVLRAEYADDKEISFTYILRNQCNN